MPDSVENNSREYQLYQVLAQELQKYAVGDRFPTVRSIMDRFQASQFTARRALARLQAERRIAGRPGSGFRVLQHHPPPLPTRILAALPCWKSPDGDFLREHIARSRPLHAGCEIEIREYDPRSAIPAELPAGKFGGCVILPAGGDLTLDDFRALERHAERFPLILLGHHMKLAGTVTIGLDNHYAGLTAIHHMARLGHRKFAILMDEQPNRVSADRVSGARHYCQLHDLAYEIIDCGIRPREYCLNKTYTTFSRRLEQPFDFTALVGVSSEGLSGVVNACMNAGVRIPHDLSVVSIGGEQYTCQLHPPLDTVAERIDLQFSRAVEYLTHGTEAQRDDDFYTIEPSIVERGSATQRKGRKK